MALAPPYRTIFMDRNAVVFLALSSLPRPKRTGKTSDVDLFALVTVLAVTGPRPLTAVRRLLAAESLVRGLRTFGAVGEWRVWLSETKECVTQNAEPVRDAK